jgi:hypothetical protein
MGFGVKKCELAGKLGGDQVRKLGSFEPSSLPASWLSSLKPFDYEPSALSNGLRPEHRHL